MDLAFFRNNKKFFTRIGIWIGITAAVVVVSVLAVVQRASGDLNTKKIAYIENQAQVKKEQAAVQNLATALSQEQFIDETIATIDQGFVPRNNPLSAITRLESLALDHNLEATIGLGSITEPDPEKPEASTPVNVTIEFSGGYFDSLEFVQSIQSLDLIIGVKNFAISRAGDGSGNVVCTLIITTYWK